jgi:hypothetical protein
MRLAMTEAFGKLNISKPSTRAGFVRLEAK